LSGGAGAEEDVQGLGDGLDLPDPEARRYLPHPVGRGRYDGVLEAEAFGLQDPAVDPGHRADFPGQADLAERDGAVRQRSVGDGAGQRPLGRIRQEPLVDRAGGRVVGRLERIEGVLGATRNHHFIHERIAEAGVDYDDVVAVLEREGVQKFSDSFTELLEGVRAKRGELVSA